MRRNIIPVGVLILALVAASALAWIERERAAELTEKVTALTAEIQQKNDTANDQAKVAAQLKEENAAYLAESSALRKKLAEQNQPALPPILEADAAAPASDPKKKGMGEFFGKMMKDPKMKEMLRQQQGAALKQMYGEFSKSKNMDAQQSDQFFALLMEKQWGGMEEGMDVFNGVEKTKEESAAASQAALEKTAETDRKLRMLLGEGGYANYKDYEKTIGERMTLNSMRQQLAVNSAPLADDQAKSLLAVMIEERAKTPASPLTSIDGNPREKMRALATSNNSDQFYQAEADLNQRVLNRASGILKPEQFSALESFQKQQLEMQKMGMEMAKSLMGEEKDGSP